MTLSDAIDVLQGLHCESSVTPDVYEALQRVLTAVVLNRYRVVSVEWIDADDWPQTKVRIAGVLPERGASDEIVYIRAEEQPCSPE